MPRRVLRAIFTAAFAQARRLTAEVEPDNRRALRQVQRLGFVYEGYRRLGLEGTRDTMMYGMLRGDCKYLPGYQGPTVMATPTLPDYTYVRELH
jgi:RimJ/RimL family protein N-acetyltransferase